ncbi:MAG: undecaprenyl-diphosphatase UppP [Candidatus Yonathbacteria bacterium CG_4_10_14_3_um_filter_47_65]|uniref:Undecaprenyl-diphosphatase n=2 Tax=Parcubacteria group TaxID=1794811 RepID=A0A2M8D8I9_9BACT|nr:MAG: undecaprenyl-diphosphatase UppP [Candidatus Nomurabacteria bacterium CG1_02_47_685]PIP03872.1 MAG: undecaprenyl-diphosphatase UppP [Candidatus Yonathbacteria bacterium CG23_combo_of_CG06-09_8_20_14_all_46_18]PIQ31754.1 MAG: undecaprenyl-diphosphatase UppP [Candidatus Yonathbacteria bacterium CG17_big_fil_post_rev_8_21_14_2_50_46_19]PIX56811.1 MAG: undecaprenyl-diphosphatase UppP [Candidatus Yonathbacteria bacterium CG_4_10_14_3_um_filter_47_65]PIY57715.1 MAG: undecaprenyl-diphosphatase 
MTLIHALILGVIEGFTEFLPVSSTGHLILVGHLLGLSQTDFQKSFDIIIQLGAIAAVVALYAQTLFSVNTIKKLAVAFAPTGVIGFAFYKIVKTLLLGNESVVLWSLFLGGIALILFELVYKEPADADGGIDNISYRQSFVIGLCQSIAIVPGVSRSAATIMGGLALGIGRKTVIEFSFLLAVPTMLAATGFDLVKNANTFSADEFGILAIGFFMSFLVAITSMKFLLGFIKQHNFIPFGVYRVVAAIAFWLVM